MVLQAGTPTYVEIFCGSGSLSAAIEDKGFRALSFDYEHNPHMLRRTADGRRVLTIRANAATTAGQQVILASPQQPPPRGCLCLLLAAGLWP